MRILIDARKLRHGGIGSYLCGLITGLLSREDTELGLVTDGTPLPEWLAGRCEEFIRPVRPYSAGEMLLLLGGLPQREFDVLHIPHYTLPYGARIPAVVTVHDLIHVNHPQRWYYPLVAAPLIRSALRRADAVIAVSASTAEEIRGFAPRTASKVTTIPNPLNQRLAEMARAERTRKGEDDYLLAVCSLGKPHKGARELLEAYQILRRTNRSSVSRLIIAGQGAGQAREQLLNSGVQLPGNEVVFLGDLSEAELAALYGRARALVVASRTEGFCLPAIEAQSARVPVIATPVPAVQEILTHRDVLAEDFTPRALAECLGSFLKRAPAPFTAEDEQIYQRHLTRFSPAEVAAQTVTVYESVLK